MSYEHLEPFVYRAAIRWCGSKDRETFPEDIGYFKAMWRSLPGLRAYVEAEALSQPPEKGIQE